MKDHELDYYLFAARPEQKEYSRFTNTVLLEIKRKALLAKNTRASQSLTPGWFMQKMRIHKVLAVVAAALFISLASISGYAYAQGTDPVSLIKRWIVGDEVHVTYQGRNFQHGKDLAYSDAAISAFAELSFVHGLAFEAGNAFTIPKDGVEHVSDPFNTAYAYPWVGEVVSVNQDSLTLRKQYVIGDKVEPSRVVDETVNVPRSDITTYIEGRSADAQRTIGKTIVVYQQAYLRYRTGSKEQPAPVVHKFAFVLTHSLAEVKEADQGNLEGERSLEQSKHHIFETDWGKTNDLCLNNGANRCSWNTKPGDAGEGLYGSCYMPPGQSRQYCMKANPDAIAYGEGLPDSTPPDGAIMRGVEGTITRITPTHVVVKASSGQLWTFGYDKAQQQAFAQKTHTALKVGDLLGGSVIGSVYDLDNRTYDTTHIYTLNRYKKVP